MLMALCCVGMLASLLLTFNLWPRGMLLICFLCFLSFVTAAQDFSGYQSDGMLLEAGFISLFFAPPGLRPRLARSHPPSRASHFLLLWECFRIYFESGVVKLASGDPQWRNAAKRMQEGIPVGRGLLNQVRQIAQACAAPWLLD